MQACSLIPIVGFLPADDPRVSGTIDAIEKELLVDGLVMRYRTEGKSDGLPAGEGAFLPCSFWLADAYALQGRNHEAVALFERLVGLANDVGLLAEEYDPKASRQVGNFPQAYSHLALIGSVLSPTESQNQTASPGESWIRAFPKLRRLNDALRSIRSLADYLDRHPEGLIRGKRADP